MLPAEKIMELLKMSRQELADSLGLNVATIYRWSYPHHRGGTEGVIPMCYWRDIKSLSKGKVKTEDFIPEGT